MDIQIATVALLDYPGTCRALLKRGERYGRPCGEEAPYKVARQGKEKKDYLCCGPHLKAVMDEIKRTYTPTAEDVARVKELL